MINQNNQGQGSQRDVNAILKAISERLTRQGQQEQGSSQKNAQQVAPEYGQNSYQATQQMQAPQMQKQSKYQEAPQMQAPQETSSFDDNFSFDDLDFSPSQGNSQTRSEIDNLLRSYNNNKKSSYGQEQSVTQQNWETAENSNQEWSEELNTNEQEIEQAELSFEDGQIEDNVENEFEDDYDSFEDEEGEDESNEFDDFSEFEQDEEQSNVHFLNQEYQTQTASEEQSEYETEDQSYQGEQSSGSNQLAMQIEYAVSQAISDCVQQWCQENLESLCREVIQSELRKTA